MNNAMASSGITSSPVMAWMAAYFSGRLEVVEPPDTPSPPFGAAHTPNSRADGCSVP